MNRKAQVTIFIIVGLLLLVVLGFATMIWDQRVISGDQEQVIGDAVEMRTLIQSCFEETTKSAIEDISLQGGYFYTPEPSLDMDLIVIPYYLDNGRVQFPTKQDIEKNVAQYIVAIIPFCVGNLEDFKGSVGEMTVEEISGDVVLDETLQATLNYPVTITKEGVTETVDTPYTTQVSINFKEIYETIEKIMEEQQKTPNAIPIGFLTAHASTNNYTFTLSYLDENTVTTTLTFPQYEINQHIYQFVFGMQYNWSSFKVPIDTIDLSLGDEICYADDPCYMNLNIYNESIQFEDMTNLFVIDPAGEINFIPKQEDVGNHTIMIRATAENGYEEYVFFNLEIRTVSGAKK